MVWKEANRLTQYNGELQDRIIEVPVEPWHDEDFRRIADKGAKLLNINFGEELIEELIGNAFRSVGVFQEILKITCVESGLARRESKPIDIKDKEAVKRAISQKTDEYSGRHLKNLETIAAGNGTSINKDKPLPYFLHYYIVIHILDIGLAGMNNGISKEALIHEIKQIHHRKDDLKGSQITSALKTLTVMQANKGISPPVIAYDSNSRQLKIVDSTFYFFLKNADLVTIKDEIVCPLDDFEQ